MSGALIRDRIFRILILMAAGGALGCQSAQQKNIEVVQKRAVSLAPLMRWTPTQCRVEARPTQPMLAMYRTIFPEENMTDSLTYTWRAQKFNCDIKGNEDTRAGKNFQGFVKIALCTLLQTHWVNSPFEDLQLHPRDIKQEKDGRVHIQTSMLENELGIYLDTGPFKIETKTKALGLLRADYEENSAKQWVPVRLEQVTKSNFVVDSIEYDQSTAANGRHQIKSLWISVGDQKRPLTRHAQLSFDDCREI